MDSIYTDYSKAFDRVNHAMLLSKLRALGFPDWLVRWLGTYLVGRTQCVKIKNFCSDEISVVSGVPQGSHIGPYLFILYLSDLTGCFNYCRALFFADDLKIFLEVKSVDDCLKLQSDVNKLSTWSLRNGMSLNISKCHSITFSRKRHPIIFDYSIEGTNLNRVDTITDLGVVLDSKLTFQSHIDSLVSRGLSRLGFVLRSSTELSLSSVRILYISLVKSLLNYASPVWSPAYQVHIDRVEAIQNKFLRYCGYMLRIPRDDWTYEEMRSYINIRSLENDRQFYDLCTFFKLISGDLYCPDILCHINFRVPDRFTRNTDLFAVPFHHTNYMYNSPLSRFSRLANSVPCDFTGVSLSKFRHQCLKT